MKLSMALRSLFLCIVLIAVAACARSAPVQDPEITGTVPTTEEVSPLTPADPDVDPPPAPAQDFTPVEFPSEAELAQARKPAIDVAMDRLDQPAEGDLVATVNGEDITVQEYRDLMRLQLNSLAAQYEIDWDDESVVPFMRDIENQILAQLIDMELLRQEAEAGGLYVDEVEVASVIREMRQSLVDGFGYATWDEYKETMELSDEGFERIIRQSLLLEYMIDRHEIETEVEQVHARHILVTDEELANELLGRLRDGEDFAALAATHSEDFYSGQQGGDLGWFPRGLMTPEFEEAAFELEPGEISDIVVTTYGFHIIEVLDKGVQPLDPYFEMQFRQMAFFEWLEDLRHDAEIEQFILQPVG
jgi:foldase protein PrsA